MRNHRSGTLDSRGFLINCTLISLASLCKVEYVTVGAVGTRLSMHVIGLGSWFERGPLSAAISRYRCGWYSYSRTGAWLLSCLGRHVSRQGWLYFDSSRAHSMWHCFRLVNSCVENSHRGESKMKASSVLKRTLSSYPTYKVIAWTIIPSFPCTSSAARLVQLHKRLSAEREIAGSNPGRTNIQGLK